MSDKIDLAALEAELKDDGYVGIEAWETKALFTEIARLKAWMCRVKEMLSRNDMTGVFTVAHIHGMDLGPDTAAEVTAVWAEYESLIAPATPKEGE